MNEPKKKKKAQMVGGTQSGESSMADGIWGVGGGYCHGNISGFYSVLISSRLPVYFSPVFSHCGPGYPRTPLDQNQAVLIH